MNRLHIAKQEGDKTLYDWSTLKRPNDLHALSSILTYLAQQSSKGEGRWLNLSVASVMKAVASQYTEIQSAH